MKAGRRLDALIAEKVMGWEAFTCNYVGTEEETQRQKDLEWWMNVNDLTSVGDYYISEAENFWIETEDWQPSTRIADAKQVLDKMIGNGYAVEIMHDCVAWSVCFVHLDTRTKYHTDWKHSIETQICLAALKAVGYDKG